LALSKVLYSNQIKLNIKERNLNAELEGKNHGNSFVGSWFFRKWRKWYKERERERVGVIACWILGSFDPTGMATAFVDAEIEP